MLAVQVYAENTSKNIYFDVDKTKNRHNRQNTTMKTLKLQK